MIWALLPKIKPMMMVMMTTIWHFMAHKEVSIIAYRILCFIFASYYF